MKTIRRGDIGPDVRRLQEILRMQAYANNITVDGIFGQRTEQAVIQYQKKNGLVPDGIVGPKTWAALGVNSSGVMQSVTIEQTDHSQLTLKRSVRIINEIIIHCTATPEGRDYPVENIRKDHLSRGFSDIGYHYVIYRDGTIHEGRNISSAGAHCTNHNAHSIGIAYVGGLENKAGVAYNKLKARDTRTLKQKAAMLNLLEALRMIYPKAKILGHRDTSPDINGNGIVDPKEWIKDCPSFDAKEEYKML
jgi:N-acetyl-anhydromuramyl-L-alanine amidase AmpD